MRRGVRSVTICSSSKFYPAAMAVASRLRGEGVQVFTPDFEHDETRIKVDRETKARLTCAFLEKVRAADAIYVISRDGYVGRSVAVEIGFATALGKPVFLSEEADEDAIKSLTTAVVAEEEISPEALASGDTVDRWQAA